MKIVSVTPPWIVRDEALSLIREKMKCNEEEAVKLLEQFTAENPQASITIDLAP